MQLAHAYQSEALTLWETIVADIKAEYLSEVQHYPWIIGFSGGKDSTLVAKAVLEAILEVPPSARTHQLDTYVCENQEVVRRSVVDHISREAHCDSLAALFINRRFDSITSIADFRREKAMVFANLGFSPDVDAQMNNIDASYLPRVMAKLAKMNETAASWRLAGKHTIPIYLFQWRHESLSTMSNPAFSRERNFRMPDGRVCVFENHLDFSASHRIHFIEDRISQTFIVGYIGDHLPTTRYPH